MIINSHPSQVPILNHEATRPQKSPDSSPESTVIQNRKVAPIPDARVVQQSGESGNSNGLQDTKQDVGHEGKLNEKGDGQGQGKEQEQSNQKSHELLSEEELREVESLAQRDREVRAHEQAHLAAAGSRATSGASFSYTQGPDGKRYAVGGEVGIDTSPVQGDPEATLRAAALIQRAALAPAEPSAQDRQVAAAANAMANEARAELGQQRIAEAQAAEGTAKSDPAKQGGESDEPTEITGDTRDEQVKSRQAKLEGIVGAVVKGGGDDQRGGKMDYYV